MNGQLAKKCSGDPSRYFPVINQPIPIPNQQQRQKAPEIKELVPERINTVVRNSRRIAKAEKIIWLRLLREKCRHNPDLSQLESMMRCAIDTACAPGTPSEIRIKYLEWIMDRAAGKASQAHTVDVSAEVSHRLILDSVVRALRDPGGQVVDVAPVAVAAGEVEL